MRSAWIPSRPTLPRAELQAVRRSPARADVERSVAALACGMPGRELDLRPQGDDTLSFSESVLFDAFPPLQAVAIEAEASAGAGPLSVTLAGEVHRLNILPSDARWPLAGAGRGQSASAISHLAGLRSSLCMCAGVHIQ